MHLVTNKEKAWLDLNVDIPSPIEYGTIVTADIALVLAALTDNSGGATADGTIAVVTAPTALTNSTGGTPSTTLAAIASGTPADLAAQGVINGVIADALASLATTQVANRTALIALTDAIKELSTKQNALIASLKTSGAMASS